MSSWEQKSALVSENKEPKENLPPSPKKILRTAKGTFAKGQSGNVFGKAIGTPSLTKALMDRLKLHPKEVDEIAFALIKLAKMGDIRATELLWERIDGKVVEKHLIEGEMPISIQFIPASRFLERNKQEQIIDVPKLELLEGKEE